MQRWESAEMFQVRYITGEPRGGALVPRSAEGSAQTVD